jgi:hypothetical protein
MIESDLSKLDAMRQLVTQPIPSGIELADLADLADQLLSNRDALALNDDDWYDNLTQHIATLDSASTFKPSNEAERTQVKNAIKGAINEIQKLIDEKVI